MTADQAERCEVATHLGPLALVVHSAEISSTPETTTSLPAPVWADEVSLALSNAHAPPGVVSTVHVFSAESGDEDFKF